MTAREYLEQFIIMDKAINNKQARLNTLKNTIMKITPNYGKEAVQHTQNVHKFDNAVTKIADLECELCAEIDRLAYKKDELLNFLATLEDERYLKVLWFRYGEAKRWDAVGYEMGCSERHAKRIGKEAEDALNKFFEKKIIVPQMSLDCPPTL